VDAAVLPIVGAANNYLTFQTFFIVTFFITISASLLTVIAEV
jgi:hypothetical protein